MTFFNILQYIYNCKYFKRITIVQFRRKQKTLVLRLLIINTYLKDITITITITITIIIVIVIVIIIVIAIVLVLVILIVIDVVFVIDRPLIFLYIMYNY